MDGFLLLSDGTRFDGKLCGSDDLASGWLTTNTAVVGFQQMLTDPSYKKTLLSFTYPEIGNVGVSEEFMESGRVQPSGLIVRELSPVASHYKAKQPLSAFLATYELTCISGLDTRGLAVHLREKGEMPGVIAPAGQSEADLLAGLSDLKRPEWQAPEESSISGSGNGPEVAVIDLGMRNSFKLQLAQCCRPALFSYNTPAEEIMDSKPDAIIVTDGPAFNFPPEETVDMLRQVTGQIPILACGLGNIALGMALGCEVDFFPRGHHGINYAVRNTENGSIETTAQRHSVVLQRKSVIDSGQAELHIENINDGSVEGVRSKDGSAIGYQHLLSPGTSAGLNRHLQAFIESIKI